MTAESALLAACAVHAGFQVVVTLVVYPALRDLPPDRWSAGHEAHTRRIASVVVPTYLLLLAAGTWVLVSGPVGWPDAVAVGASVLALATTAVVAAPLHGRLAREGRRPPLLGRLLLADRVRFVAALIALAAAAA